MEKIYCSSKGFWKGLPAVEKLAKEAEVSREQALDFCKEAGGVADGMALTRTKNNNKARV